MEQYDIYNDIMARTNGDIYIGVVGPVRTGKSTFIKRFMDLLVLPNIENVHSRERAKDELPQSAAGKTIMTTEPKFIPKETTTIKLQDGIEFNVRLIDCVGYMVDGASGHIENDQERMVKTPWFDHEIPFTQAAEMGTKKVINDHSTIGIVITTDGSIGEIPRQGYIAPEERTINELKKIGKPFIVLLNSSRPYADETKRLQTELEAKYGVTVLAVNCEQLRKDDIAKIMENILMEFPVSELNFKIPKWAEMLPDNHWLKLDLIDNIRDIFARINVIRDVNNDNFNTSSEFINKMTLEKIDMSKGCAKVNVEFDDSNYYKVLSDILGKEIKDEYHFITMLKKYSNMETEYNKVSHALDAVKFKGYGVVTPVLEEIRLSEPELIKHGNKYGIKLKATAPTVHMIRANIETEVAPIVGSEQQATDMVNFFKDEMASGSKQIWESNIFGKSLQQLVDEGLNNKIYKMTDESQLKLQETLQRIINEGNGGLVCIII
ncbi:MAG: spoIVA [Clostridiales bacterium]|nr:spoIVA [Clostridiales bacterium]